MRECIEEQGQKTVYEGYCIFMLLRVNWMGEWICFVPSLDNEEKILSNIVWVNTSEIINTYMKWLI